MEDHGALGICYVWILCYYMFMTCTQELGSMLKYVFNDFTSQGRAKTHQKRSLEINTWQLRSNLKRKYRLVGGIPNPLQNMKVSWDSIVLPNTSKTNVPNHQPVVYSGSTAVGSCSRMVLFRHCKAKIHCISLAVSREKKVKHQKYCPQNKLTSYDVCMYLYV